MNDETDAIEIEHGTKADEQNEGLIESEIKATKEEMDRLAFKISESEEFHSKFDYDIVSLHRVKNSVLVDKQVKSNHLFDDTQALDNINTKHALVNINPYERKTNVLEKAYKDTLDKLPEEERKEKENTSNCRH